MRESVYQALLIDRLERTFPGCVVLKLDSAYRQGTPDLLVLYRNRWAMLEVKRSEGARERPNQRYYQELYDRMSFCAFIYPENEEEVFSEIQRALRITKHARLS